MNVFLRLLIFLALFGGILFIAAGRIDLPFCWVFLGIYAVGMAIGFTLMPQDLLQERIKPGPGGTDRALRFTAMPFLVAHLIVAGLDAGRFGWTGPLHPAVQVVGLAVLASGLALSIWAISVNRFFSPVVRIQTERGHHLVTDGPMPGSATPATPPPS